MGDRALLAGVRRCVIARGAARLRPPRPPVRRVEVNGTARPARSAIEGLVFSPGGAADVSQGRQPLDCDTKMIRGPGGAIERSTPRALYRPSGARTLRRFRFQGLTPLANVCRPSGAPD